MQIIVNHLTRMEEGYMCVGGVIVDTHQHVRPVLKDGRLETSHLSVNGGPFDIANVVDLGEVVSRARPPHVEDRICDPQTASLRGRATENQFWQLLRDLCQPTLKDIFGDELKPLGTSRGCGTDEGCGKASLGCLSPTANPQIYIKEWTGSKPKIRMHFTDGEIAPDVSVTDIRLYEADHITPDVAAVERMKQAIAKSAEVILSVGLGRAFSPRSDCPRAHWVQVNNVHLVERPTWRLW